MFKLNEMPNNVAVFNGVNYSLDLSFDNVLDTFEVISSNDDDVIKVYGALSLLVEDRTDNLEPEKAAELLVYIMGNFVNSKKEAPVRLDLNGNPIKTKKDTTNSEDESDPVVSFIYDAEYIWTSFYDAYHIDLHQEFGNLSYQKFLLLFRDLPDETKIKKIIEIRTWKPVKGTSSEEKERMRRLQDEYRLPDDVYI